MSVGIGLPGVSIGINLPMFPLLVVVPGYPVHYAPRGDVTLFFYDGLYRTCQRDNWYASSWYNGPWGLVDPDDVPAFVPADTRALLSPSACRLGRVAVRCAATLGRAPGP